MVIDVLFLNSQQVTVHMGALINQNSVLRQQNTHLFEELDTLRLEIAQQQINYDQLLQKLHVTCQLPMFKKTVRKLP
ncbi:unnamed protein product [Rotaria socialis]|uniref:Uncharacterized protein n=1 Tax=Rotaria socialis TaxID=392032 RepID=A0A821DEI7_9BILA|nr:unnamed protein product [Rotaria socialis]CAF4515656.1 unnamed protein product [Rotaria socialis]CAF4619803.1 unnamed protein product [Rotaria socialis]CAF4802118.1 unnamed protein product [Rotaria socialis]CAF4915672.1 unnamed protein product [Rotaria socialis]